MGYVAPWGAGPLEAGTVSRIGVPLSYDFSDEPDGAEFPGAWEFFAFTTTAGVVTGEAEPDPTTYFSIQDGLGYWHYDRVPLADPYVERGFGASPAAALEGRNARMEVAAVAPTDLLDQAKDKLVWEVTLVLRANDTLTDYVGVRARAVWEQGLGWTTPLVLELVRAQGLLPVVLESVVVDAARDAVDTWAAGPQLGGRTLAGLSAEVRNGQLVGRLNGILELTAAVPDIGRNKPGLLVKVHRQVGVALEPLPSVLGVAMVSLRDLERLGPSASLLGETEAAPIEDTRSLPVAEWLALGFLKRMGARQFEVVVDFDAHVLETQHGLRIGDVLRAVEPYAGQLLTACILDLKQARGRGR